MVFVHLDCLVLPFQIAASFCSFQTTQLRWIVGKEASEGPLPSWVPRKDTRDVIDRFIQSQLKVTYLQKHLWLIRYNLIRLILVLDSLSLVSPYL